ncbi:hypothetical protein OE88DRAFT_1723048 [Heliocybe sulcata]|uniref:Uncharacterized protein n=1 Tax=Heliocybe sulcata TaxID=5364 RepID=A0A5C3NFJ1_9AGAM|nr:hypothetical protein OE88DRAFT_1723048 [Heliocybe sulcata]
MSGLQLNLPDYLKETRRLKRGEQGKENHSLLQGKKRKRGAKGAALTLDGHPAQKKLKQAKFSFGDESSGLLAIPKRASALGAVKENTMKAESSQTPGASRSTGLKRVRLETPQSLARPITRLSKVIRESKTLHRADEEDGTLKASPIRPPIRTPKSTKLGVVPTIPTPPSSACCRYGDSETDVVGASYAEASSSFNSPASVTRTEADETLRSLPRTPLRCRSNRLHSGESEIVPETPPRRVATQEDHGVKELDSNVAFELLSSSPGHISDPFGPISVATTDDLFCDATASQESLRSINESNDDPSSRLVVPSSQSYEQSLPLVTGRAIPLPSESPRRACIVLGDWTAPPIERDPAGERHGSSSTEVVPSSQTQECTPPELLTPPSSAHGKCPILGSKESSGSVPTSQTQTEEELVLPEERPRTSCEPALSPMRRTSILDVLIENPIQSFPGTSPSSPERIDEAKQPGSVNTEEQSVLQLYTSPLRAPSCYTQSSSQLPLSTQSTSTLASPAREFRDMFEEEPTWLRSLSRLSSIEPTSQGSGEIDETVLDNVLQGTPSKSQSGAESVTEPESPEAMKKFLEEVKQKRRLRKGGSLRTSLEDLAPLHHSEGPAGGELDHRGKRAPIDAKQSSTAYCDKSDEEFTCSIPSISGMGMDFSSTLDSESVSQYSSLPSPMKRFLAGFKGDGSYPDDFPESLR